MPETEQWITIGKITRAHGIRGEVKVALFVDDAEFLQELEHVFLESRPRRKMAIESVRFHRGQALLQFEGIDDRNEAERLRNRELLVPFEWLPELEEDEYYVTQIIGLAVETEEGEVLGEVDEIIFTGANEVYIIRGGPRGEILLPAIESVVQSVDLEAGRVVVTVPEGLLE
ncbi:MAG: ribosome maturation factor RimM [Chloroflexota bacterium]|nr:ribosome maturation factor RimM [Chloroflexota bacterium]